MISTCHEICDELAHQIILDKFFMQLLLMQSSKVYKFKWSVKSWKCFCLSFFLEDFDRKKSHWMLALILDFKSMHLISSYVGCENLHRLWLPTIDSKLLSLLLVELYKSLMPNAIEEPYVLGSQVNFENLFHTIEINPNTLKQLVSRKFNNVLHYPIDTKCKCALG